MLSTRSLAGIIKSARSDLKIMTGELDNSGVELVWEALEVAAKRGVRLALLLNARPPAGASESDQFTAVIADGRVAYLAPAPFTAALTSVPGVIRTDRRVLRTLEKHFSTLWTAAKSMPHP